VTELEGDATDGAMERTQGFLAFTEGVACHFAGRQVLGIAGDILLASCGVPPFLARPASAFLAGRLDGVYADERTNRVVGGLTSLHHADTLCDRMGPKLSPIEEGYPDDIEYMSPRAWNEITCSSPGASAQVTGLEEL
jgi:hypothetical protein